MMCACRPRSLIGMVRVGSCVSNSSGVLVFDAKSYCFETKKWDQALYSCDLDTALSLSDDQRCTNQHVQRRLHNLNNPQCVLTRTRPCRLTGTRFKTNANACFSPDGSSVAFLSNRGGEGSQAYILPMSQAGEAVQLTEVAGGISNMSWPAASPDRLLFSSEVYVDEAGLAGKLRGVC